jgi:hypothetical protein
LHGTVHVAMLRAYTPSLSELPDIHCNASGMHSKMHTFTWVIERILLVVFGSLKTRAWKRHSPTNAHFDYEDSMGSNTVWKRDHRLGSCNDGSTKHKKMEVQRRKDRQKKSAASKKKMQRSEYKNKTHSNA